MNPDSIVKPLSIHIPLRRARGRYSVRTAVLAALCLSLITPVSAQQTRARPPSDQMRVFVDVDGFRMGLAETLRLPSLAGPQAMLDQANAKRGEYAKQKQALSDVSASLSAAQLATRNRQLRELSNEADDLTARARAAVDEALGPIQKQLTDRYETALADYARGNPVGAIEQIDPAGVVIVRSGVHDITDSLLEMAKSGPGAEAPAAPAAPPVTRYVDFRRLLKGTGYGAAMESAAAARTKTVLDQAASMESSSQAIRNRMNSQQGVLPQAEIERLSREADDLDRQRIELLQAAEQQDKWIRIRQERVLMEKLGEAVRARPFAEAADVVRVLNRTPEAFDAVRLADPKLDLTPGAMEALQGLKPPP